MHTAINSAAKKGDDTTVHERKLEAHMLQMPPKPMKPTLLYADATLEAMAFSLAHNLPFGGMFSSEAGSILGGAGMSNEGAMKYLSFINVMWDGGEHKVTRRSSESFTVRDARLSISLAVQADTLRAFFTNTGKLARGTGFLARFLMAIPESTQGTRMFEEAPLEWPALRSFHLKIRGLLDLMNKDEPPSVTLSMSSSAKAQWINYHNDVERELSSDGELAELKDVASKAADNVARMAALFHVYENGPVGEIAEDYVRRASTIVTWHLFESRRFLTGIALPQTSLNTIKLHQWLIDYCLEHGLSCVEHSKVRQSGPNPLRNKESLEKALTELKVAHLIEITVDEGKKFIHLNPASLAEQKVSHGAA